MKSHRSFFCAVILSTCFSLIAGAQPCTIDLTSPNTTVCSGSDITFSIDTSAGCNPFDFIEWYNGSTLIATGSETDTTLTAPITAGTYDFNVLFIHNATADTAFDTLSITVTPPLTPANVITAAQSICSGDTPDTLTGPTISGGTGTVQYLWQVSTTSSSTGFINAPVPNSNQDYGPPALTATQWYRRIVSAGPCSDTSASIEVTVILVISSNTIAAAQTICASQVPAALTGSNPSGGNGSFTYLWEESTTGPSSGFSAAALPNSNQNYQPPSLTVDTWYRRVVTSGSCTSTSTSIAITVDPALPANTITAAQSICSGEIPASLTGTAVTGGTYLWQVSTTGPTSGFGPAGGTSQNFSPPVLTADRWYRRVVTSGACSDTSSSIKITVKAIPSVTVNNLGNPICNGDNTSITLSGAPNNVAGTLFTWTVSTTNLSGASAQTTPVAGPIQQTVTLVNGVAAGSVTYTITPEANGCLGQPANATTTVNPGAGLQPVITTSIVNDTVCSNTHGVNFMISNYQDSINYVWNVVPASISMIGDSLANCILNIPSGYSGNVTISTTASNQFSCSVNATTSFFVDTSDAPDTTIIYLYNSAKTLICMNNTFDSYQWGYDSLNLSPVSLTGEIYQDLILNSLADTLDKYFWVITRLGTCYTKSYFNPPSGFGRSIDIVTENQIQINIINQEPGYGFDLVLNGPYTGPIRLYIYDTRGSMVLDQVLSKEMLIDHKTIPFINKGQGIYLISLVTKNSDRFTGKFFMPGK